MMYVGVKLEGKGENSWMTMRCKVGEFTAKKFV